jgi:uncharacterized protein YdeI (YjbR/CyaY-like superfamily)
MNPIVTPFFEKVSKWQDLNNLLREIVLSCGLYEELKWGVPCYTFNGNNVLIIHGFKNYTALNFFKGALLEDAKQILVQQTENVQSARQVRFTEMAEIVHLESALKHYIYEAIEIEKLGLKITPKKITDFEVVDELTTIFSQNLELKKAFEKLTPGRKRGYLLHFSKAKQPSTRISRIEACTGKILKGIGLTECDCGLSKRKPNCDGSHKKIINRLL